MVRHAVMFIGLAFFALATAAQTDRQGGLSLTVKVNFGEPNALAAPLRVQLFNGSGMTVGEAFTQSDGSAHFVGLPQGSYRLRVSGADVEETTVALRLYSGDSGRTEFVSVRRKSKGITASNGTVSSATLNVPEKAHKEFERGMQLLRDNKLDDAEKHLSKAVTEYPQYAAALNALGVIFMRSERISEAQNMFEKAISADSQTSETYVNLAKLLIGQKKNDEAEALLVKAISMSPHNPDALAVLANLDLNTGKLDDAIANAQRVHTLPHVNLPATHLIAAVALEKKQLYAEAAVEYKQFLEEAPNSTSAGRVRAQLDAIAKRVH